MGPLLLSRRPIAADAPGSGRSAPRSFAVARWGDASGIDPLSPGSETPAGRALSGRSLARSAWWAQVYAARGEPRMRQYDGWISNWWGAPRRGHAQHGQSVRAARNGIWITDVAHIRHFYSHVKPRKLPEVHAIKRGHDSAPDPLPRTGAKEDQP